MSFQAKVFGKKQVWAEASPEMKADWKFERRPGGWVIGTHSQTGERVRFSYHRVKNQFWAKLPKKYGSPAVKIQNNRRKKEMRPQNR